MQLWYSVIGVRRGDRLLDPAQAVRTEHENVLQTPVLFRGIINASCVFILPQKAPDLTGNFEQALINAENVKNYLPAQW
jgi:hypothetical protein